MNQEKYLKERLDDQINWYDKKSGWNQRRHKFYKIGEAILAVSIPILSGFSTIEGWGWLIFVIAVIGGLITVVAIIASVNKYHENWVEYRLTSEVLKREKYLFSTNSGKYKNPKNAFNILVEVAEAIMSNENETWRKNFEQDVEVKREEVNQAGNGESV